MRFISVCRSEKELESEWGEEEAELFVYRIMSSMNVLLKAGMLVKDDLAGRK